MINMEKNSSNKEEDLKEVMVVVNNSTFILTSETLMTFSKNFSEGKIHLLASLMMMTISFLEVSDEEE